MQMAEFLSDLTSLQACDRRAALALVSARPPRSVGRVDGEGHRPEDDVDLQRAKDVLDLHGEVKVARAHGIDEELTRAREAVAGALGTV